MIWGLKSTGTCAGCIGARWECMKVAWISNGSSVRVTDHGSIFTAARFFQRVEQSVSPVQAHHDPASAKGCPSAEAQQRCWVGRYTCVDIDGTNRI